MSSRLGAPGAPSPLGAHRGGARSLSSSRWALPLLALLSVGCFDTDKGPAPPDRQLYYPTGIAVSPGGKALFVANSDFDLQYRAGTVQALDLGRLRTYLQGLQGDKGTVNCQAGGLAPNTGGGSLLYPGPCSAIDLNNFPDGGGSLVRASVDIGAFASDMLVLRRPTDEKEVASGEKKVSDARLAIPVRGDPSVTWIDIDDDLLSTSSQTFRLDCGQGSGRRCAESNRAGIDPASNLRELTLPGEPFEIAASDRTDAIVVTHQTSGAVSLLLNGWKSPDFSTPCAKLPERPTLSFVLGGLPTGATGTAALPMPRLARLFPDEIPYTPAFLVSYRNAAQVDLVRFYSDCQSAPSRPFLALTGRSGINANAGGFDSRSITVDPDKRRTCEDACCAPGQCALATDGECLAGCAGIPVDIYVANRTPPSLLVGRATGSVSQYGTEDYVSFGTSIPLAQGASRVELGHIIDRDGVRRSRVFILCFDARLLYVYDPEAAAIEAVITTGRGPSALAFDPGLGDETTADTPAAPYGYLAHFTDSYLAVLDLDMRHTTYLTLIASVGIPTPPRES